MNESTKKKIKLLVTFIIIGLFIWFLVINPMIIFHNNEKKLEAAGKRYFELNSSELPTGERVKTVGLKTLSHKSYVEGDLFIPYTDKTCSISNSWVKVRRVNGDFKYYVYLECGILASSIDHRGPEIKLSGDSQVEVALGGEYHELGVKSVVDDTDGKMKIKDVIVTSDVDTSKIGTYQVKYSATDALGNKSEVIREVNVVERFYSTIKNKLKDTTNFVGNPTDNFIRLSNILFRVYGVDSNNNVIIVADEDISNVNYSRLDKWLDYFYDNLNKKTKSMIKKTKFCNMTINESSRDTTKCSSYTEEKNVYIPSVIDVNKAQAGDNNFMKPYTMSWVSNPKDEKHAYVTRSFFLFKQEGQSFLPYYVNNNFGVRPMMTVNGNEKITGGKGTRDNPYVFGDTKKAKYGSGINTRFTGEYIDISGVLFRIIEVMKDGTTKVVSNSSLVDYEEDIRCTNTTDEESPSVYNPNKKGSAGYYINNNVVQFVDTSYFTNHEINVPVYKGRIIYKSEVSTKKYKVLLSAPNMYEMFSAQVESTENTRDSFWYLNESQDPEVRAAVHDIGVPTNEKMFGYKTFGVRVVGFLKKDTVVAGGKGTINKPYKIK